jgi:hypothetical protein
VCDLIEESYRKFGHLEDRQIGQLRLKYRLRVVQNIEDHTMKNILRSVSEKTMIKGKELEDFYMLFKVNKSNLIEWSMQIKCIVYEIYLWNYYKHQVK